METSSIPHPDIDLATHLYYQLVYTLTDLLPPPLDDTPEALCTRSHAAIAKVAALLPVNANEADLAAQCIAARAQAEDLLRLLRQHVDDISLVMRLNAQYGSMVRTSLSVHARLMRVQALRQKREAIEGATDQDAWAQHVAERSMTEVLNTNAGPHEAALPEAPPAEGADHLQSNDVSEDGLDSHTAAFETWLITQCQGQTSEQPDAGRLHDIVRKAMAGSHLAAREFAANNPENPARTA